jgi:thymidine kinase
MGKLTMIVGPMFSGKTTELLRILSREEIAKRTSILFKPKLDNRYSEDKVVNHNGVGSSAVIVSNSSELLNYVTDFIRENKNQLLITSNNKGVFNKVKQPIINVFIDEVQFFDSKIIDVVEKITSQGINVYISSLNQTFEGKPFPFKDGKNNVGYLLAMADNIIHLSAVCTCCGGSATKSMRLVESKDTVVVGGANAYQARCTKCFRNKT